MTHDPEFRRLFVNRLWTTILEATDCYRSPADRARARRFLVSGAGFEPACLKAGLDPVRVRHHALNLIGHELAVSKPAEPLPARTPPKRKTAHRGREPGIIRFAGKVMTRKEWADEIGIPVMTLNSRLHLGWCVERALTTPHRPRGRGRVDTHRGVGRAQDVNAGTGALPTAQISG